MNKKLLDELTTFPKAIDAAIKEKFGIEAESSYSFIDGNFITQFSASRDLEETIRIFIDGYLQGNNELSNRVYKIMSQSKIKTNG